MQYYHDNLESLLKIKKNYKFFIYTLFISFTLIIISLLSIKIYDFEYIYLIKSSDSKLTYVTNTLYENTASLMDYKIFEYKDKTYEIEKIDVIDCNVDSSGKIAYTTVEIKTSEEIPIENDVMFKIKLLKNKQSIIKKIVKLT